MILRLLFLGGGIFDGEGLLIRLLVLRGLGNLCRVIKFLGMIGGLNLDSNLERN